MLKRLLPSLSLFLLAHTTIAQVAPDAEIQRILADRIDQQHQSVGIVVGVIEQGGRRIVAHGSLAKGDKRSLDGDTVFEIGSMTKVFTSLLLADMVGRGEVALTDPVAKYLPAEVKVPERGGAKITLQHLAMHTSALPRLPSNLNPKDANNPYADYTVQQLYEFLSSAELTRDIGSRYEYSNLGGGLLGHALARRAGTDYETLVRKRILDPLGMKRTGITLSKSMKERLATGHDETLKPALNWDIPTLAGAGALRSTANDMLTFLAANLGTTKTALAAPMVAMLVPRHATEIPNTEIALGWHVSKIGEHEIVWHNGGTGGYRSFMGFDPKRRIGVVVLSNTSTNAGVDDIGRHLLAGAPLLQPPKTRKEVKVDPKLFDRYTGRYELAPNVFFTITRDDAHLYAQLTGQPRFEIYPEGERDFFYKVVDAQITFVENGLVLHQNGMDRPAKRIGDAPPVKEHHEIAVDPKIFDRYVGKYQLAPAFVLTITRDEAHLYAQATGQPRFEIFPESETEFFLKVVDAQITFGDKSLVLHQNGMDMPAKRIE
jgi:D-alanyl-D-alanine-carboxypeptidase/D-alanyl-D-alanine-endopeptidase